MLDQDQGIGHWALSIELRNQGLEICYDGMPKA